MAKELADNLKPLTPQIPVETKAAAAKPDYKSLAERDRQKVKGIFRYHEVPGGCMEFSFKKWHGDQVDKIRLLDGEISEVSFGVATHLNKNCWYPVHSFEMDEKNNPAIKIHQKIRRMSFQSLEFVDPDELRAEGIPAQR